MLNLNIMEKIKRIFSFYKPMNKELPTYVINPLIATNRPNNDIQSLDITQSRFKLFPFKIAIWNVKPKNTLKDNMHPNENQQYISAEYLTYFPYPDPLGNGPIYKIPGTNFVYDIKCIN